MQCTVFLVLRGLLTKLSLFIRRRDHHRHKPLKLRVFKYYSALIFTLPSTAHSQIHTVQGRMFATAVVVVIVAQAALHLIKCITQKPR